MVRSFSSDAPPRALLEHLFDSALRAPSAGNARGVGWLVLTDDERRQRYWERATDESWRRGAARFAGLSAAPVIALSLASPGIYLARYAEADKAGSGLAHEAGWPVPYWYGDAAFSTMTLLHAVHDVGLGACFLGAFRHSSDVLDEFRIDPSWRLFGAVLIGYPDGSDHRSRSLDRPGGAPRLYFDTFDVPG